jgi:DNA-binding transcriptional MerR regulator
MKINEVCEKVDISKDNLRFYEKEGLIRPERDLSNNYRDYSEDDIVLLEKIKLLRSLGIPVRDIRKMIDGDLTLDKAVTDRLDDIEKQKKELEAVKRICSALASDKVTFSSLDAASFIEAEPELKDLFRRLADKDTADMELTTREFDAAISKMMTGAYLISAVLLIILGRLIGHDGSCDDGYAVKAFLAIYVAISVLVSIMSVWSSKVRTQVGTFMIASVTLAPSLWAVMIIAGLDPDKGIIFFAVQAMLVLAMYILRRRSRLFIEYIRYPLAVGILFCVLEAAISTAVFGPGLNTCLVAGLIGILLILVPVSWTQNGSPRYRLTLFHAAVTASRMIMPGALFTSYHGQQSSWRRYNDEPKWFRG